MNKQKIVIVGDVLSGPISLHGPFDDSEHANQWISLFATNQVTHIMDLQSL